MIMILITKSIAMTWRDREACPRAAAIIDLLDLARSIGE
jgi:hypothetical protein